MAVLLAIAALPLGGCESGSDSHERVESQNPQPDKQQSVTRGSESDRSVAPQKESGVAQQPGTRPQPTSAPTTTQAAAESPEDVVDKTKPRLPPYLTILERIDDSRPASIEPQVNPPRRLALHTTNVRRMRIDRRKLDFPVNKSVVLRIDEQGMEWVAGQDDLELVRSRNGDWNAVPKPKKP
jgi:hypothetical protein